MDIIFKTAKLEKQCNDYKKACKIWGLQHAYKIIQRLQDLRSFDNLAQVPAQPPFKCHQLTGNNKYKYAITSKEPFRIIFKPANNPLPLLEDGAVDISKVTIVEIWGVENYHDK